MTMTDYGTIEQRVTRGAAFLDQVAVGWEGRINLETLELRSAEHCICGQVFEKEGKTLRDGNGYGFARSNLFTEGNAWVRECVSDPHPQSGYGKADMIAADLGFAVPEDLWYSPSEGVSDGRSVLDTYDALQTAWTALVKERFNTGALSGV